jgi:hypothetical protein
MKKLIMFAWLLLVTLTSSAQVIKLKLNNNIDNAISDTVKLNIDGNPLLKGDYFYVYVNANLNNNIDARSLYFDFEYQNTAYTLVSVEHTGTMGNGGLLPGGSQISLSTNLYSGYRFASNTSNTTSNGNTNYYNANYSYSSGGNHTIIRSMLTWATNNNTNGNGQWGILKLKFQLNPNVQGFIFDPIKMNFAAAYNKNGGGGSTIMEAPLIMNIYTNPDQESFINAKVETNGNVGGMSITRVAFLEEGTNTIYVADATENGTLNIDQTKFKANTTYKIKVGFNADAIKQLYNSAITVSDYTTAQAEFITQNLDGSFNNNSIKTGIGYTAADINVNKALDGGDVTRLFAQAVTLDTLFILPPNYTPGTDTYLYVSTYTEDVFNAMTPSDWKDNTTDYVTFKTGVIGSNIPLNLKYIIPGDINRSHSSQVVINNNIITNAKVSLKLNMAKSAYGIANTYNVSSIDINLNNITITSNDIEIPININTNNNKTSALQFEFVYDPNKIKFEEIKSELPNTWYIFASPKDGKIKFGAINQDLKDPFIGTFIPFKLKFSSIGNGLDLATQIKVVSNMDASDDKGNQLKINLNSTTIKLTGYNNF